MLALVQSVELSQASFILKPSTARRAATHTTQDWVSLTLPTHKSHAPALMHSEMAWRMDQKRFIAVPRCAPILRVISRSAWIAVVIHSLLGGSKSLSTIKKAQLK